MPRSLINVLGVVVTIAVLAVGIFFVAGPLVLQAFGVVGQTATVAGTNALYEAQVDHLQEEKSRLDEIEASVADLQTQITPANELDDVFELVANAAQASGVTITSISAGDTVSFVTRTSPTADSTVAAPATTDTSASAADTGDESTPADSTQNSSTGGSAAGADTGRVQVEFTIDVNASSSAQAVAFLDALRGGPRLLGQVDTTVSSSDTGFNVLLTALAFVLPQGG